MQIEFMKCQGILPYVYDLEQNDKAKVEKLVSSKGFVKIVTKLGFLF